MNQTAVSEAQPAPFTDRYRIEFPPPNGEHVEQDEASFDLVGTDGREEIRFHDYAAIYNHQGLYEQLFYDRLKCRSPEVVIDTLRNTLDHNSEQLSQLRVLDFGAGNGIVGEGLWKHGVARLVGADILEEARDATDRDRPGIYDAYSVADFTQLDEASEAELKSWAFNCLVSVAALGFGDTPPQAWAQALDLVEVGGWIAFNIRDSFLDASEQSGFSKMVRELIFSEYLDLYHLERYQHRYSINGDPLYYFVIVGRKAAESLPPNLFD